MTTTKMKSLCLRRHEVRALLRCGRVLAVRVVKPQPKMHAFTTFTEPIPWMPIGGIHQDRWPCPFGKVGDRLRCKEKWRCNHLGGLRIEYAAGGPCLEFDQWPSGAIPPYAIPTSAPRVSRAERQLNGEKIPDEWRPSIHMPDWCSRLTVEVAAVQCKRLNAIAEDEAKAAGIDASEPRQMAWNHRFGLMLLWNKLHGPDAWASNPYVWLGDLRRVEG